MLHPGLHHRSSAPRTGAKLRELHPRELRLFSLKKKDEGRRSWSLQFTEKRVSEVGAGWFSQVTNDRTRGNGHKLPQGRFMLDVRKNVFTERILKFWNRLSRDMVDSSSLELFQSCVDMVLGDVA